MDLTAIYGILILLGLTLLVLAGVIVARSYMKHYLLANGAKFKFDGYSKNIHYKVGETTFRSLTYAFAAKRNLILQEKYNQPTGEFQPISFLND